MFARSLRLVACLALAPPGTLLAERSKGELDEELGRYEQAAIQCWFSFDLYGAELCWAKGVARCEQAGADPLDLAAFLNGLGATQLLSDKPKQAEVSLRRSLKIRQEKLGDKDKKTLTAMRNLSQAYIDLAKFKNAEELLCGCHRSLKSEGKGGLTEAQLLRFLGRMYLAAGRYDDAEGCLQSALREGRRSEETGDEMAWSHRLLADVYLERGNAKKAEAALASAAELDPFVAKQLDSPYARVCLLRGELGRAEEKLAGELKKLKSSNNPDPLGLARNRELLARVKVEQKKLDEAAALFQECLKLRTSVLGDDHPLVAAVLEQQCRHLPQAPEGAAERARAIRKKAEANRPLGLAKRQAAGELLFEGSKEGPKD